MAKRVSRERRPLPKGEREQIHREREQFPARGKRKPKHKVRQIDVHEWTPTGRKKPRRRVWRTFPRERCVEDVDPACRYCSVGQPLEIYMGKGKKKLVDPSVIEGWAVLNPKKKIAMKSRRTGRGMEYFLARFPSEEESWEHAKLLAYACDSAMERVGAPAPRPEMSAEEFRRRRAEAVEAKQLEILQEELDPEALRPARPPEPEVKLPPAYVPPRQIEAEARERMIYSHPRREWERAIGEHEAEVVHRRHVEQAIENVRYKRRKSASRAARKPEGVGRPNYGMVFTLGGPIQWGRGYGGYYG